MIVIRVIQHHRAVRSSIKVRPLVSSLELPIPVHNYRQIHLIHGSCHAVHYTISSNLYPYIYQILSIGIPNFAPCSAASTTQEFEKTSISKRKLRSDSIISNSSNKRVRVEHSGAVSPLLLPESVCPSPSSSRTHEVAPSSTTHTAAAALAAVLNEEKLQSVALEERLLSALTSCGSSITDTRTTAVPTDSSVSTDDLPALIRANKTAIPARGRDRSNH